MKSFRVVTITIVTGLVLCSTIFLSQSSDQNIRSNRHRVDGFAVLELFTSQGCSSCPAAEALLARIQEASKDKPVYVLSYHVDYWNRLGWKDVFSSAESTARQYEYSKHFSGQVYTPQLIINGKSDFVGSDSVAIAKTLNESLSSPSSAGLQLRGRKLSTGAEIAYHANGMTANDRLLIALVKRTAQTNVKHGENRGRTLSQVQIVNKLYAFNVNPNGNGIETVNLPADFDLNDWDIVGILQDSTTRVISAAAHASFPGE